MRIRRITALAAITAAALALTGCAAGAGSGDDPAGTDAAAGRDLTLTTANGELALDAVPERIVAFDYATLDTLQAIGVEDVVVGTVTTTLPDELQAFADTENVGTLKEPDFEAVAALDPDLIIISARMAELAPQLEEIAPVADLSIDTTRQLESSAENALAIAGVFGKADVAQAKIDEITTLADEIRGQAAEAGSTMFLMTSGGKVSTYGPGSRYGFLYDDLGFEPAVTGGDSASRHGQEISFEFIAEQNPSNLLVIDRDATVGESGQAAEALLDNALVGSTDAWKNDRVAYLDGVDWYFVGGGLDTTTRMLEELRAVVEQPVNG